MSNEFKQLEVYSRELRIKILEMVKKAGGGHIGGSYSVIDLLNYLYAQELRIDPNNPKEINRDYLIYSKGHSSLALYTTLSKKGFFDEKVLDGYCVDDGTIATKEAGLGQSVALLELT